MRTTPRYLLAPILGTLLLAGAAPPDRVAPGLFPSERPLVTAPEWRTTGYPADGVQLLGHLSPAQLGSSAGNDCWGYVSPSGREYALMGCYDRLVVVEITTPTNPAIVGSVTHSSSLWADIKVYEDVAYVSNESGGGVDVVDLADVDNGVVTLVQRMTTGGLSSVHNIAVDTDSGFLYLCIGNINGGRLVAYDLSSPRYPTLAGSMTSGNGGVGQHDAQIVTYTSGPWAGRQVCFGAAQGQGLDVIDVTDKSNMFLMSRTTYPSLSYAHQCWLSEDRQYLYLNDETDGLAETRVFDVSDLEDPVLLGTFGYGSNSIDHNLYVKGDLIYEANYTSGLRVLDLGANPVSPPLIAYFDTYPANDGQSYNGMWSCYPFFPSGTVIGSDLESGLFVLDVSQPELDIDLLDGDPDLLDPSGDTVRVSISGINGGELDPDSPTLHYDAGEGEVAVALVPDDDWTTLWHAVFPPLACEASVTWHLSAASTSGQITRLPNGAPGETYSALVADDVVIAFEDDFQADTGWTVSGNADDGQWQRGVPAGGGDRCDPATDGDWSGSCYVTDNADGNSDVDGGSTILTSPLLDATGATTLGYWRWYNNGSTCSGGNPMNDIFEVEISDDGGATWSDLETVGPSGGEVSGGWFHKTWNLDDLDGFVPDTQMRLRFTASDEGSGSVIEAGVDGITLTALVCEACPADVDGDGTVAVGDVLTVLASWGTDDAAADVDGDGIVAVGDLLAVIAAWGPCP